MFSIDEMTNIILLCESSFNNECQNTRFDIV
jgi:hypothetical protein